MHALRSSWNNKTNENKEQATLIAAVEREGKYQGEPSVGGLNLSTKSF